MPLRAKDEPERNEEGNVPLRAKDKPEGIRRKMLKADKVSLRAKSGALPTFWKLACGESEVSLLPLWEFCRPRSQKTPLAEL